MKKIIDAMDKGIGMLEKIVLFGSITVMLIVTAIEVLDAKVLHANLMWTTEVNRIMLVWCILSGASVAAGTRSHLGVEFLVRKMPKKIAKWVVLFTDLICIFVSGYVVASGIALFYKSEDLEGKKIALVCNLKPATLCGVESNGMILASGEDPVTVLFLNETTPLGSRIR